jgi:hypothetical protein
MNTGSGIWVPSISAFTRVFDAAMRGDSSGLPGALLPGDGEGEFAVADAHGKALGETRRRLLAVG